MVHCWRNSINIELGLCQVNRYKGLVGSLTFIVVYGLSYVSPALRLLFILMKLFRIFKKPPRLLDSHGQATDVPTASVPAANSTYITSSHPIGAEILVQGEDPIIAE